MFCAVRFRNDRIDFIIIKFREIINISAVRRHRVKLFL